MTTTLIAIEDNHFDGMRNTTQGQEHGGDGNKLSDLLQATRVDLLDKDSADTALGVRMTAAEGTLAGFDPKASVRLATDGALGAYTQAGTGVDATLTQNAAAIENIDGVAPVLGNRILVKDGAAGADNGIYTVTTVGTGVIPQVLTRATDADTDAKVTANMFTQAEEGTANADTSFRLTTNNPIVVDTTALTFEVYQSYETVGNITDVDAGDAAAAGVRDTTARGDHEHGVSTAAPGATGVATASAVGVATDIARSDHAHQSNTAPTDTTKAAAVIGTSGEPARADHKHDISTAAAEIAAPDTAAAEGAGTALARAAHVHGMPCAAPAAIGVATAAAEGVGTDFARNDHAHQSATAPADTTVAAAAIGTSGEPARADHKHNITNAAAIEISGDNAAGVATTVARSDHMHKLAKLVPFLSHEGIATAAGNAAAAGAVNSHRTFDFDDGLGVVDEQIAFEGVMPQHYDGDDITVRLFWACAVNAGDVLWNVFFERIELGVTDITADSYAAAQVQLTTSPGTVGFVATTSITFTQAQADAIAAGEHFRLLVMRDSNDGSDNAAGDAQLLAVDLVH